MMRVLAFSDWRTQPIEPLYDVVANLDPPLDLILYAGDDIRRFVSTTHNHFHGLAQAADAHLGFVLGNDDRPENLQHLQLETSRVTDLHRSPLKKHDYTIIGQAGDVGESSMGFIQFSENQASGHLEDLYADVDTNHIILVSHTPPFGALDYAQRHNSQRIGSDAVRNFATEVAPVFVLCGHVHQFGGQTADKDYGPVLNLASHDGDNSPGKLALIEIPDAGPNPDIEIDHTNLQELARRTSGVDDAFSTTAALKTLTQIGPSRATKLQEAGIETIADIVNQPEEEFVSRTVIPAPRLQRAYNHALAFYHDEARLFEAEQYDQLRNDEMVLVDIETNLEQSQIWCIGIYSYRDDEFTQLVSLEDEQSLLEDFRDCLNQYGQPSVLYYAGNSFDENRLSEAAERADIHLNEVSREWVDLCLLARKSIFLPQEGHELETVASALGYIFEHPDVSGLEVGSVYSTYQSDGEVPEEGWTKYLEYNRDDVLAIKHILDTVVDYCGSANCYVGTVDEPNLPADRDQYEIASLPANSDTQGEYSNISAPHTGNDAGDDLESTTSESNPYEPIRKGSPIAKWTEANPVNNQATPIPTCSACGKILVNEYQRKEVSSGENPEFVCQGECSGFEDQTIICYECGELVSKQYANPKYRINDGQTLWYCPSCD